jgi:hypothetical protein
MGRVSRRQSLAMLRSPGQRVPFFLHRVVNELTTFSIQSLNKGCWLEWLEVIKGPEDPTWVVKNGYVFAWWDNADKQTFIL